MFYSFMAALLEFFDLPTTTFNDSICSGRTNWPDSVLHSPHPDSRSANALRMTGAACRMCERVCWAPNWNARTVSCVPTWSGNMCVRACKQFGKIVCLVGAMSACLFHECILFADWVRIGCGFGGVGGFEQICLVRCWLDGGVCVCVCWQLTNRAASFESLCRRLYCASAYWTISIEFKLRVWS